MGTDGTATATSGVAWQFGIAKTPDGKHWITCTLTTPLNQFSFGMPPDAWQGVVSQLPATIEQLSTEAKRLDIGLEIAQPDALKKIHINKNGRK